MLRRMMIHSLKYNVRKIEILTYLDKYVFMIAHKPNIVEMLCLGFDFLFYLSHYELYYI